MSNSISFFWNIDRSSVKVMIIHTCMIQNRHLFTTPILLLAEAVDFRIIFSQQTTINSGEDVGCTYYNTVRSSQFMRSDRVSIRRWTDPETMIYAYSGTSTLKEWNTQSGAFTLKGWNLCHLLEVHAAGDHHSIQTPSDTERQMPHAFSHL